jgi:hypothetical protein
MLTPFPPVSARRRCGQQGWARTHQSAGWREALLVLLLAVVSTTALTHPVVLETNRVGRVSVHTRACAVGRRFSAHTHIDR